MSCVHVFEDCWGPANGYVSTGKSRNAVCDVNRRRYMGLHLISHEIHDAAALYQMPLVKAGCKHSGWTLIRFIT